MSDNVLLAEGEVIQVNEEMILTLKTLAWSHKSKRSRLVLHSDSTDKAQEMVIVAHRLTYIRPHRHPSHKSESYHLMEGELAVRFFDNEGSLTSVVELTKDNPLVRMTGGRFHQPTPKSDWVVYHETYSGPFRKDFDVVYAPWAVQEK